MYEAKLEFPEGWGVIGQIPSVGGMDIFWNHTLQTNVARDSSKRDSYLIDQMVLK